MAKKRNKSIGEYTEDRCTRCGDKVPKYRDEFCTQKCRKIWKNPSPYSRA